MTQPPQHPRTLLAEMQRDRATLRDRATMPRWFSIAVGLVLASWVASPAVDPDRRSGSYVFAVVAILLLLGTARRSTGVRLAAWGSRGWLAGTALLAIAMALFSISLALVSLDLSWFVIAPSVAMFAAGWGGVHFMAEAATEKLREVR